MNLHFCSSRRESAHYFFANRWKSERTHVRCYENESKKRMVQLNEERGVALAKRFSKEVLLPRLVAVLEEVEA